MWCPERSPRSRGSVLITTSLNMAMPKKCPGCLKSFISQRAHLAQASNPLCRRLAKKRRSSCTGFVRTPQRNPPQRQGPQYPSASTHNLALAPTDNTPPPEEDSNRSPSPELPHTPHNDENGWDDEDLDNSDEDLDDISDSSPPGWEPPVSNDTGNVSIRSDDEDQSSPSVPLEDLRERTWVTPNIVKFPNLRAGEPLRSVDSTNSAYATLLGGGSASNPYTPFASKIDWEVAKWAKLQGPSSASLMELLKIEGVMQFHPTIT